MTEDTIEAISDLMPSAADGDVGGPGARTQVLALSRIVVWDNARKTFEKEDLESLAMSMRSTGGAIQDPFGYLKRVGDLESPADGVDWVKRTKGLAANDVVCVLLGGERRYRATALNDAAGFAGFDRLWVKIVPEPTRKQKFTLNLTENMQRVALKFSEEADRITTMLAETNEDGSKVWTQDSFAEAMGYDLLKVKRIVAAARAPERVVSELDAGRVSLKVAALLGGLPQDTAELAANDVIFAPTGVKGEVEAAELIARKYRRELKLAIFGIDEEVKVSGVGGQVSGSVLSATCRECLQFSGNRDDVGGKTTCLAPSCFVAKQTIALNAMVAGRADFPPRWRWQCKCIENARSVDVLSAEDVVRLNIFDSSPRQLVDPASKFVDLADVPPGILLKPEHRSGSGIPIWGVMLESAGLPLSACVDEKGRVRLMVELKYAVDGARLSPYGSLFSGSACSDLMTADEQSAANRVKTASDGERRAAMVAGSAELMGRLVSAPGSAAQLAVGGRDGADALDALPMLIRGVWSQGLQKDDLFFLCEVIDGPGVRPPNPRERLVAWLDSSAAADLLLGMLVLSHMVRHIRMNGFAELTEVDDNDFNPWARIAASVGFDAAGWVKQVSKRVAVVERKAREKEDEWLKGREAERLGGAKGEVVEV